MLLLFILFFIFLSLSLSLHNNTNIGGAQSSRSIFCKKKKFKINLIGKKKGLDGHVTKRLSWECFITKKIFKEAGEGYVFLVHRDKIWTISHFSIRGSFQATFPSVNGKPLIMLGEEKKVEHLPFQPQVYKIRSKSTNCHFCGPYW